MIRSTLEILVQDEGRPTPADTAWDPSWWPRGGSSLPMELVGYAFLAIGSVVLAWLSWNYARWTWRRTAPLRLFWSIARDLSLSRAQAFWLWRVARRQKLASPITLLLSPATLDHHLQQFLEDRPTPHETLPPPLAAAREQLFGSQPSKP